MHKNFWIFLWLSSQSKIAKPHSRQIFRKSLISGISCGLWQSELNTSLAPVFWAIFATCLLVSLWPFLQVISRNIPFFFASRACSIVIFPGWARMLISEFNAAMLVPFTTGSTEVSPWAIIILIPCLRAYLLRRENCSKGMWVNSIPGKTLILFFGQFFQKQVISETTRLILEISAWSVMAIAVKPFAS